LSREPRAEERREERREEKRGRQSILVVLADAYVYAMVEIERPSSNWSRYSCRCSGLLALRLHWG